MYFIRNGTIIHRDWRGEFPVPSLSQIKSWQRYEDAYFRGRSVTEEHPYNVVWCKICNEAIIFNEEGGIEEIIQDRRDLGIT